jgi:predicted nucleic acid-binding protein
VLASQTQDPGCEKPPLDSIKIRYVPVSSLHAVELARQARLTACDAAYLWLAKTLKADLVTLDERLEKAA